MYRTVTVQIELVLDDMLDYHNPYNEKRVAAADATREQIVDYLNYKLYNDPEYFGDFGKENILKTDLFID